MIRSLLSAAFVALALTRSARAENPAPLRVGVSPIFPPVVCKEGGKIVGIEVDFANSLGSELGRPVQLVELAWEDQIPALTDGKIDIIMSGMSITRARELRVAFAKPYLGIAQMPLVRREDASQYSFGFPSRTEAVIGVIKATTGDYLVQQEFPTNKRKEYKTGEAAAKALIKKRVDLFICDAPTVWWLAGMHEADGLVVVPVLLTDESLAWGMRRSDTALLDSVNQALDKLQKNGQANKIIKHWIPLYK
jgi:ABC-type amino acid transport substrate-binding protein